MSECSRLGRSLALPDAFGNGPAAVNNQLGARDKPRGRLAEVKGGLGHIVGRTGPAGHRLLAREIGPEPGVVHGPGGHRRVDQARGEQVEPDPVRGISRRRRQGQRPHGPLAGRIGERAEMLRRRRAVEDRSHVHHRAPQAGGSSGCSSMNRTAARLVKNTPCALRSHHAVPAFARALVQRPVAKLSTADPGDVQQDIEPSAQDVQGECEQPRDLALRRRPARA